MDIITFSYRLDGKPTGVPVVDCRGINNPHHKRGNDEAKRAVVRTHPLFEVLVQQGVELYRVYGEVYVGCTWGRHRSVAVATEIERRIATGDVK